MQVNNNVQYDVNTNSNVFLYFIKLVDVQIKYFKNKNEEFFLTELFLSLLTTKKFKKMHMYKITLLKSFWFCATNIIFEPGQRNLCLILNSITSNRCIKITL